MKKYYFLGIGGVSMSALAVMLKHRGFEVGGYDEFSGKGTEILNKEGIDVDYVLNEEKILQADEICYSSAIKQDNPLFIFAKENDKKMSSRGKILGQIASGYEKVIAVAGSHGKTTTTAMIYQILMCAGKNPTLHLGGYKLDDGLNFHLGDEELFVTEACEYHDNFLFLKPYISVVTNIEKEHLDYFKTFQNQLKSFEKFKEQSEFVIDGMNDLRAKNVRHVKYGRLRFGLYEKGKKIFDLNLNICEDVNTQNCIYAYQVAKKLGIDDCLIKLGLESYMGVSTRFEKVCCPFFDAVVCDYAHHPTEISKAINSAKKIYKNRKVITIFQPHTYSRTKLLLNDFVKTFQEIEEPLFFKTYSAREKPEDGLSALQLAENLKKTNKNAKYFENFEDLKTFLLQKQKNEVMLLFVGAGDLPKILHKNNFIS